MIEFCIFWEKNHEIQINCKAFTGSDGGFASDTGDERNACYL
jgi:hypothetical protein